MSLLCNDVRVYFVVLDVWPRPLVHLCVLGLGVVVCQ